MHNTQTTYADIDSSRYIIVCRTITSNNHVLMIGESIHTDFRSEDICVSNDNHAPH